MGLVKINLLPWREDRRLKQNAKFRHTVLMVLMVCVVIVGLVYAYVSYQTQSLADDNEILHQKVAEQDTLLANLNMLKKQKQQLMAQVAMIDGLQGSKADLVALFEHIAKSVSAGMFLTNITEQGGIMTITGHARHTSDVSAFAKRLDMSHLSMSVLPQQHADEHNFEDADGDEDNQNTVQNTVHDADGDDGHMTTSLDIADGRVLVSDVMIVSQQSNDDAASGLIQFVLSAKFHHTHTALLTKPDQADSTQETP